MVFADDTGGTKKRNGGSPVRTAIKYKKYSAADADPLEDTKVGHPFFFPSQIVANVD